MKVPNHIAIILDGNGRWAKSKGMPRNYGHVQGAKTVETICEEAYKMGISYLTVYAFSTENWNIPVIFDGVHFSEEGHRIFAAQIKTELSRIEKA